jgi:hypothetical protein
MTTDNGIGSDWAIAIGGRIFVGRVIPRAGARSAEDVALSPCYELIIQPTPQGVSRMLVPLLFFTSERSIDVTGLPLIHFDTLSKNERRGMQKCIEHCESMIGKMKAQESGLLVVPELPKGMPPIPRDG